MQRNILLVSTKSFRFVVVGSIATLLDFALINLLNYFDVAVLVSNIFSTSSSMIVSFFGNKKYTFYSKSKSYMREVMLFFAFTTFGLWVIQSFVIQAILPITPTDWSEPLQLNVAKVIATLVSMVWNYLTYSKFVFRRSEYHTE